MWPMANDRVWLGCPKCGGKLLLWKHTPGAGHVSDGLTVDSVGAFFGNHLTCADKAHANGLGRDCGLRLWTEESLPATCGERGGSGPVSGA